MCDAVEAPGRTTRRSLIGAALAGTGAAAIGGAVRPEAASALTLGSPLRPVLPVWPSQPSGTVLTLLGTSGGPQAEYVRTGTSSVLTVEGSNYLIDAGRSSVTQYLSSGLRYSAMAGMFFTHLHADHLADYYNFFLLEGGEANAERDRLPTAAFPVFGPGRAGWLPPKDPDFPTIAPDNPTPGLLDLTQRLNEGYAYHYNLFMRGPTQVPDIRDLQSRVKEIVVPADANADPAAGRFAPTMQPFLVHSDGLVQVTAVLVPHGSVFPSFAFRFDTAQGSVVFSGDTTYSDNVVTLATGADILVHEVMDLDFLAAHTDPGLLDHLKASHTPIGDVAKVATLAGVRTLVLNHLIPSNPIYVSDPAWRAKILKAGYRGKVYVGNDRDQIPLPVRR